MHHCRVLKLVMLTKGFLFLLLRSVFTIPTREAPIYQCRRHRFDPWVGKIPWRRKWQPSPVLLPGKSHGQRSLEGCIPWGHKELDTTERLTNDNFAIKQTLGPLSNSLSKQDCCHSVGKLCPTFCNPMECNMPGLPVPHRLLEFAQVHGH